MSNKFIRVSIKVFRYDEDAYLEWQPFTTDDPLEIARLKSARRGDVISWDDDLLICMED